MTPEHFSAARSSRLAAAGLSALGMLSSSSSLCIVRREVSNEYRLQQSPYASEPSELPGVTAASGV